jgi:hypothetical protein
MLNASQNPGGAGAGMGAGLGAGMGAGLGMGMAMRSGPWGAAPAPQASPQPSGAVPPPMPRASETVWHIAVDGQSQGPYGRGHLGRLAADGSFTRDTLVWSPGQDGWKPADEVAELAQLFTMMPPPLPTPPVPPQA